MSASSSTLSDLSNRLAIPFMFSPVRGLLVALLSGCCAWLGPAPVHAQDARPRSERAPVHALRAVDTHALPTSNNAALRAQHPLPSGIGPLRFAEPMRVALSPETDGTWEQLNDGTWLWRLRLQSAGALSLSLGFTRYRMPPGGTLFVYTPDGSVLRGPFTAADNAAHGELWTPLLHSDDIVVEVSVPPDARDALDLALGHVSHGFRSITARSTAKQSGACNVDVACNEATPWRAQARAVGRYTVGGGVLCSGALVNNTALDQTPYFLTANHCGIDEENAASVVVYWNFENSFCRAPDEDGGGGDGALDQFSSGAILRARTGTAQPQYDPFIRGSDFALIELDTPLDASFDAYFAGWDRADAPTTSEAVSIHHPHGEEKRISFDLDATTVTSYLQPSTTVAPTHLRVGNWEVGTTEVGSSGSPLFDADQRIVGILSGGFAGCSLDDPTVDNDAPDWYGRLAYAWDSGTTPSTRLRDWLDPLGAGTTAINGINLENDTTPPGPIDNFSVVEVNRDRVTLSWQAPGDDGLQGTVAQYELRYSTAPIRTQEEFESAQIVLDVPTPGPPRSTERVTVSGLQPSIPYYFAILARDNGNNSSPLASISNIPPGPISDFAVTKIGADGGITLQWQAPGGDGFQGTASEYELHYSTHPIPSLAEFDTARVVPNLPPPRSSGNIERVTVTGLQPDTPYYFAVLARDEVNSISPLASTEENTVILNNRVVVRPGYPNPFRTSTRVGVAVDQTQTVRVDVFDATGRHVQRLFDGPISANTLREFQFGEGLSSGVYFVHIGGEQFERTTQVVRIR